jgi:hypothetical protein
MGNGREFGLHGGPGKGSKTRVSDQKKFSENFDEINWHRLPSGTGQPCPGCASPIPPPVGAWKKKYK